MEIDKIEAGPEMDTLIAEKVMGWKLGKSKWIHDYMMHGMFETEEWKGSTKGILTHTKKSWHPSTDISTAWEVVEKLKDELPQGIKISFWKHEGWCVAWKFDSMGALDDGFVLAPTVFLAICRAALKVIENKIR